MKLNCRKGDLAVLIRPHFLVNLGKFVQVLEPLGYLEAGQTFVRGGEKYSVLTSTFYWWVEAQTSLLTSVGTCKKQIHTSDRSLRPIRDQPGNEDFVTKARKTLPRAKPVTGPVTINARGEVAR